VDMSTSPKWTARRATTPSHVTVVRASYHSSPQGNAARRTVKSNSLKMITRMAVSQTARGTKLDVLHTVCTRSSFRLHLTQLSPVR
jgi:hypothetical protein